jgi:hypothetical protein
MPTVAQCVYSFHEFQSGSRDVSSDTLKFLDIVFDVASNRSLFTTVDGRICLGPRSVRVGDVVAVFLRCATPLVLRPNRLGQFKLTGEAECYGLMQGEALLGPLDSGWKQIWRHVKGWAYEIAFKNMETGDIAVIDPRLGPLPSGWNAHYVVEAHQWWFWPDGAKNMTVYDPRLTPESLTKRGVEVRHFEIV